jgi:SARP family transcriptional regulator, regulator of embCAB operon
MTVEGGGQVIRDSAFRGRQMRLAFTFLTAGRLRPQPAEDFAQAVWPGGALPPAWDAALSSIVSKLRTLLRRTGLKEIDVTRRFASLQLVLPSDTWVDLEAAPHAIDEAEGHYRARNLAAAWGAANVAVCIAREPLLPEESARWLADRRAVLKGIHARGLSVLSGVSLANREEALAVEHAQQLVQIDPFREGSYRQLMETLAALGNRAEALNVYARCRAFLREELGTSPSADTEAVYIRILQA